MKAFEIVESEKTSIFVRLGAFHLAMSFTGAIGYLMSGSGVKEAMKVVYAKNIVPDIMSGKVYSRAVRAHTMH